MTKIELDIMPKLNLEVIRNNGIRMRQDAINPYDYIDMKKTLMKLEYPILLIDTPLDLHNISLRMKFDTTVYYPDTVLIQDCKDLTPIPSANPSDKPSFKTKNISYIRKPLAWIKEMITSHGGNNNIEML